MAIGNPFGFGGTVTAGIVSARGRNIGGSYDDYIQTDASINRGNSGGPLFDMKGNVVGINTAIFSQSGGSVGIGFAVSSNLAKQVSDQLRKYGRTKLIDNKKNTGLTKSFPKIGFEIKQLDEQDIKKYKLKNFSKGIIISNVKNNSKAFKSGLREGMIIVRVGQSEVSDLNVITNAIEKAKKQKRNALLMLVNFEGTDRFVAVEIF